MEVIWAGVLVGEPLQRGRSKAYLCTSVELEDDVDTSQKEG